MADVIARLGGTPRLDLVSVEVPLCGIPVATVSEMLGVLAVPGFVEIPVAAVSADSVRSLTAAGLRLKLRTGGVVPGAFPTEAELAEVIARCAAESLAFKCTAGLHNAVRHSDPRTGFEHHGFLNVALAVHAAVSGRDDLVQAALAEQDPVAVAAAVQSLSTRDVGAIRRLFCSVGTCSVSDPIGDLTTLGFVGPS